MAAPTKTQGEAWTDTVAARIQADIDGISGETLGQTVTSLWDQIDASGDPAVEAALMTSALAQDAASLPETRQAVINTICSRACFVDFMRALSNLVASGGGGSYDSLDDWASDKAAKVHPLAAEVVRVTNPTAALSRGQVFAPQYACIAADRIYTGADGSLVEDTTDAGDVGTADVDLFASDDDTLYIGSQHQFSRVVIALSTAASATIVPTVEYWNGTAWTAVSGLTDNSAGLTRNDTIVFTLPADWVRTAIAADDTPFDDLARLYYLRIARTANSLVTPPVASMIWIAPVPVTDSGLSSGVHLGVPQGPMALARITGTNTMAIEVLNDIGTRFDYAVIQLRALTAIGSNLTVTISYENQDGDDVTQAQSSWTAPAAAGTKAVTLNGSDTGVASINSTGWAVTTAATEGVFEVMVPALRTPAI